MFLGNDKNSLCYFVLIFPRLSLFVCLFVCVCVLLLEKQLTVAGAALVALVEEGELL